MYKIENRYQDEGWMSLKDERYYSYDVAYERARELCKDAICYGMTRVKNDNNDILVTFPAGGGDPI